MARSTVDQLLAGNAAFVTEEWRPNAEYYKSIAARQTPKVLWIGCSDSRVSEHQMTGSKPGTMFVHRNVANIVAFNDVNISAILEYGVVHLKIEDIIICGHTRCCGIAGTYGYKVEKYQIGMDVGEELFDFVRSQGPAIDMTACDSETCRWQLEHGTNLPSRHPIEVLAAAYGLYDLERRRPV